MSLNVMLKSRQHEGGHISHLVSIVWTNDINLPKIALHLEKCGQMRVVAFLFDMLFMDIVKCVCVEAFTICTVKYIVTNGSTEYSCYVNKESCNV